MTKILLLLILLVPSIANAETTVLYPTFDTRINPAAATTNYDTNQYCQSTAFDGTSCLIKFDLSGFVASEVISASIRLYADVSGATKTYALNRVLKNWVSNQATWNIYATASNWGTAGATGAEVDYTATHQMTMTGPNTGYVTVDVTDLVKDMINSNNYGFLLRPVTTMYIRWYMSEVTGTTFDPQLSVRTSTAGLPTTWYVRTDGGTCGLGNQCEGTTDAAYPGSGTNGACACALPSQAALNMVGEDIMMIKNGTYNDGGISTPAGTSTTLLTKVYGEGYANCTDPSAVTIWTNSGGTSVITMGSYTDLECLTLTDHQAGGNTAIIDNTASTSSTNGIRITNGSTGIIVKNVDVYGLARGVYGSQLGDFTGTNLRLIGNWSAGWDSDINADDSYTGTVTLNNATIDFNGCAMKYPLSNSSNLLDTSNFHYCCSQDQGCYGDGIGLGDGTAGNWVFNGGSMSHNTSDGLDTLHGASGTQTVKRVRTEGNAGNQLKVTGATVLVEDSVIIGNCGYFDHQTFTVTPDQNQSTVGLYLSNTGYAALTGTGIAVTNEAIGTGDGVTTVFTGTTTNFPIKNLSATISYTQSGVARTATAETYNGVNLHLKGNITGTGISNIVSYVTSYLNYKTGQYQITFTTPPDNGTPIKFDSYTYNDIVPTGTFTGDRTNYYATSWDVVIDGTGSPNTFKWRKNVNNGTGTYTTGVAMTGSAQLLGEGVSVQFKTTTGHTLNDSYSFKTTGASFNNCRATGNPISLAAGTGSTATFINNTIVSNGDTTFLKSTGACVANSVITRNNIIVGGTEYNDGSDKSRQFYALDSSGAECGSMSSIFNSDYDTMCAGKVGQESDCTGEGAHNTCYSSCASLPFSTAAVIGPSTYYTAENFPVELSSAFGNADETVSGADAYDFNYSDRGAAWDAGAVEYGSVAATCSDSVQNGLEEGVDCGGICLTACAGDGGGGGDEGSTSQANVTLKNIRLIGSVRVY